MHWTSRSARLSRRTRRWPGFRFYEELNDFLAPALRKRDIEYRCARAATVKNAIEALGVPHTEVELILVNGESVDFSYLMRDADRVSVYPKFESFDIRPLLRVRDAPLRELRFVADAHLGGLARLLRMLGFDTLYSNTITDEEIRDLAQADGRIVLTRDRELLKRREITHGCFVRALKPSQQLREIVQRLQLDPRLCRTDPPSFPGGRPGSLPGQAPTTPPAPPAPLLGRRRGRASSRGARAAVHALSALQLAAHAGRQGGSLAAVAGESRCALPDVQRLHAAASGSSGKARTGIACGRCWRTICPRSVQ